MIRNDAELEVEKKALGHLERALESLRERVLPKNPRNFEIYSEGYVEQINLIKAEIDAYLARKSMKVPESTTPQTASGHQPTGTP
jgi:hypothetical protein